MCHSDTLRSVITPKCQGDRQCQITAPQRLRSVSPEYLSSLLDIWPRSELLRFDGFIRPELFGEDSLKCHQLLLVVGDTGKQTHTGTCSHRRINRAARVFLQVS